MAQHRGLILLVVLIVSGLAMRVDEVQLAVQRNDLARRALECSLYPEDIRPQTDAVLAEWTKRVGQALASRSYSREAALVSRCWAATADWLHVAKISQKYPPTDAATALLLGQAQQAMGQPALALQTWQAFPQTALYFRWQCTERLNASDCPAALSACEAATSINWTLGIAFGELGRVYTYCTNRFDDALAAYQQAIQLGSGSPTIWLAMAHTLDMLGRSLEAVQVIEKYQLTGALSDAIRGNAFRQRGQLDDALEMYQRAVAQDDQNQWFYHLLALTYKDLGRTADAVAAWRQTLHVSPGFGPAVEGLRSLGEK